MKTILLLSLILLALSAKASLRSVSTNTVIANSFYVLIDANKNVLSESSTGTVMTSYGFDASFDDIDRVTQWDRDNATESQTWTLDLIGNWGNTTGSLGGTAFNETRTHNGVHELTAMGSNSVTYDDKGNMTTDANANTLVWDIDNHLESFGTVDFTYDALGRRLEKIDGTDSTLYICNGQRVIEEYEDSGSGYALARSYVHGSYVDDILCKVEDNTGSPTVLYYHSDRQFNVRGLSNSTGNIIELYAYSVYGQQTAMTSTGGILAGSSNNNSYGFTGRYLDDETGLWYFRARYFNDEMGRFINRDPLGYVDGMSLYNGYFAEGFALDPSGNQRKIDVFASADDDSLNTGDFKNLAELVEHIHTESGYGTEHCACVRTLRIASHGDFKAMNFGEPKDATDRSKSTNARELAEENVEWVGKYLKKSVNFCKPCYIILNSCNVGLSKTNWINKLAASTGCTVYAPMGMCYRLFRRDYAGGTYIIKGNKKRFPGNEDNYAAESGKFKKITPEGESSTVPQREADKKFSTLKTNINRD